MSPLPQELQTCEATVWHFWETNVWDPHQSLSLSFSLAGALDHPEGKTGNSVWNILMHLKHLIARCCAKWSESTYLLLCGFVRDFNVWESFSTASGVSNPCDLKETLPLHGCNERPSCVPRGSAYLIIPPHNYNQKQTNSITNTIFKCSH